MAFDSRSILKVARSVVGMVLGYTLFVFGTIVGRLPFPDLGYYSSSPPPWWCPGPAWSAAW